LVGAQLFPCDIAILDTAHERVVVETPTQSSNAPCENLASRYKRVQQRLSVAT